MSFERSVPSARILAFMSVSIFSVCAAAIEATPASKAAARVLLLRIIFSGSRKAGRIYPILRTRGASRWREMQIHGEPGWRPCTIRRKERFRYEVHGSARAEPEHGQESAFGAECDGPHVIE